MVKRKIFIVDDDPDELYIMNVVSKERGLDHISLFEDSEHLLAHLDGLSDEELPDLVLSDLNMPKFSGLDVIRNIRSNARFSRVSVFIYSTSSISHEIDVCLKAGAKDFIVKPNVMKGYEKLVDKLLLQ